MNLRVSTVRRGDKVYRYAQLVQSYRREHDGKPTCRVIASLGALDDVTIANLREALAASREGAPLVLPEARGALAPEAEVLENLRYLDLAVLLRLWEEMGLARLVHEVVPAPDGATADVERVIAALVLQRCVAPASKLAAERWYPTTALPELLAVAPAQFNNSRVHRALAALEAGESGVQARLPGIVTEHDGAFATVFIDATDTWFVGHGPPLAAKGVDKEGLYRRRVGIVLLCDERGYPLRWHTLSGRYHDPTALLEMASEAAALPWLRGKTVVLDRAVGNAGAVEQLAASSLRFLTGLPHSEFISSGAPVDWEKLATLQAAFAEEQPAESAVATAARLAGFEQVRPDRYVLDLGVFAKARARRSAPSAAVVMVEIARYIRAHASHSTDDIARRLGCCARSIRRYRALCGLLPELHERVLDGEADGLHPGRLIEVAKLPPAEQAAGFDAALLDVPPGRRIRASKALARSLPDLWTRGVLCFHPDAFRRQRQAEAETLKTLRERVEKINRRIANPNSTRKDAAILGEIGALIRRVKFGDVVTTRLENQSGVRTLVLEQDAQALERRRRSYGVTLLVGHPELPGTAADLVALYFSKDAVEKDFQTIKSVIELRPVRHRTDPKVRAHVTICMLALLLDRVLTARLAAAKTGRSALSAYEALAATQLNRVRQGPRTFYTVTTPAPDARALVAALGMDALVQNDQVRQVITPR